MPRTPVLIAVLVGVLVAAAAVALALGGGDDEPVSADTTTTSSGAVGPCDGLDVPDPAADIEALRAAIELVLVRGRVEGSTVGIGADTVEVTLPFGCEAYASALQTTHGDMVSVIVGPPMQPVDP